jgi:hypothetical protein
MRGGREMAHLHEEEGKKERKKEKLRGRRDIYGQGIRALEERVI